MAIKQCADFIATNPLVSVIESHDTGTCAKLIARNKMANTAAIASELAAELYDLKILKRNIETHKENYTRFFVLSKGDLVENDTNKSTLSFQLGHEPGSLAKALNTFQKNLVNISKIQSVPNIGEPNRYRIYADVEWLDKLLYDKCLKELRKQTIDLHVLGEYKKHELNLMKTVH